ncbi:Chromosome segregation and cytokinesis defective protein 1 [Caenorhabditis elegans]|uniref:Chromosome segregation and cytokinesis defective protein 1 n=1 Tax=Caenorhabditis elegans TaxID=6239 RepID=CSC1_CAEEL|nr:Chromosome segregation and cytokinesis defective protein 1 [Caenorhabditis elegans]O45952.1 RecName: Full=Chromosome segregation and cytokinesis defective protein 1 [Caenorhabditis elegans]CAB07696.1 Chromosome segregation and cytokinesis defective protein 1 [Caenorhabditis elegans]|eukprot:NP_496856.1 Chromosome segregation and cytokinesis defective protein 1 [Caenorhabditis elegans]
MPPRKIKKDPAVVAMADTLETRVKDLLEEYKKKLREVALQTAKAESDRIIATIKPKYRDMPIMEFLASPPDDFYIESGEEEEEGEAAVAVKQELPSEPDMEIDDAAAAQKTSIPIGQNSGRNTVQVKQEPEIDDDAAHETSIPIAPSGQNSGRNTAADEHRRNEIITPAGQVLPLPTLQPEKPFRAPHVDEEIAFSVNGSPLVLAGRTTATAAGKENRKKSKKSGAASKKAAAAAGPLQPETENAGTSV